MNMHDLGDLFVCGIAAVCIWIYRREAHFAWASQGRAIERAMVAEDALDEIRARRSEGARAAWETRRQNKSDRGRHLTESPALQFEN